MALILLSLPLLSLRCLFPVHVIPINRPRSFSLQLYQIKYIHLKIKIQETGFQKSVPGPDAPVKQEAA